jgi:hypothetical protein
MTLPADTDEYYVAFCDVLGFSDRILTDFDGTREIYQKFGETLAGLPISGADVTIYSDAILVTSKNLAGVLVAVQGLWFVALQHDMMIRGGISKGRYWSARQRNHLFVASDALVRAVRLEKSVGVPAVVVADDIEVDDGLWLQRFQDGLLVSPVLHFRDRNIVNPFNTYWYASAKTRALQLMEKSPKHRDKYLWFLALHDAVGADEPMIPPAKLKSYMEEGSLKWNPPTSDRAHR